MQGSGLFPFVPSFQGALQPAGSGSVVEGEVVEHRLVRGYASALWLLPLLPLASVVLSLVLSGSGAALRTLLWAVPALPLVVVVQHVWFAFVRRLYARQHGQLREYLATCCQASPQEV